LYEAAQMDGAGKILQFVNITVPSIPNPMDCNTAVINPIFE